MHLGPWWMACIALILHVFIEPYSSYSSYTFVLRLSFICRIWAICVSWTIHICILTLPIPPSLFSEDGKSRSIIFGKARKLKKIENESFKYFERKTL